MVIKKSHQWWCFALWAFLALSSHISAQRLSENEMREKLQEYTREALSLCNRNVKANWNVATDIGNQEKASEKERISVEYAKFQQDYWRSTWHNANISDYQDESIKRHLQILKQLGTSALSEADLVDLTKTITKMSSVYSSAKVCPFNKPNCNVETNNSYTLDPEIYGRFAKSRNYDELEYLWKSWRDSSGKKIRQDYKRYVALMTKAAKENGFQDAAAWWQSRFEDPNLTRTVDRLWDEVAPLYNDLHEYTRYKLIEIYGNKINRIDPNIPAHLLGNVWAQSWTNLYDDIKPFKNASLVDITTKLNEKKYDAKKLFEISDDFYTSLGLPTNMASFTGDSIIEKPKDRVIQCHASAWDFCDGTDFRIKMCTNINMEDFVTIHHEMGHIQYYIQYKDLPVSLRGGANPAFHEAVGDTMAISVSTPQHLIKLGLLNDYKDSVEDNINALFAMAVERVAFLPFGLLMDKWRWDVFSGRVPESSWNSHWWSLRRAYQKVAAPVERSEDDFDPGSKFHVPGNSQYISYFLAHILEFQFYEALCIEAGEYDPKNPDNQPLHKCDFYKSKAAGNKLSEGLKLGASKHWVHALRAITNKTEYSASSLLTYFKPLQTFLKAEIAKLQKEDDFRQVLDHYEVDATAQCNKLVKAEWAVATDINNNTKQDILNKVVAEYAQFAKNQYDLHFKGLKPGDFSDESLQRQVTELTRLGTSALDEQKLNELMQVKSNLEKFYNNAKFCDYHKPNCNLSKEALTLDPEITALMASSNDFEQLKYTWVQWHNKSGALMRDEYKKYVALVNEAAKKNGFADYGEMWRAPYEDPNLIENMQAIWKQVEPLYNEIHTYTRRKLIELYPRKINQSDPLIPGHLLGNMWGQSWINLFERIKPYKESSEIDITASLKEQYTPIKMFQESDRFYKSLGLASNEMSYTGESVIEKPQDRVIICHASAWDFCDGKDFRIKQCTGVNHYNFMTIHHEMGHIQYYIQYKDQPISFRTGANPGFHEAVGDLMALSVATPQHLQKIGLLKNYKDSPEDNINALLQMALERVSFLPFGLLIDLYRWDIFSGKVPESQWNAHWERLREQYQKVRSPVLRTEAHFDAGAKYHVPGDTPYIAYFFAHILEFQLHRSLCKVAGQYDPNDPKKPLHKCDIGGSLEAGKRLEAGLSLGASKHWKVALHALTGEDDLSAEALLEYFKPLQEFLHKANAEAAAKAEEETNSLIPYIVGGVLGVALLIGLVLIIRNNCNKPK